jgi:hypothetical protein
MEIDYSYNGREFLFSASPSIIDSLLSIKI